MRGNREPTWPARRNLTEGRSVNSPMPRPTTLPARLLRPQLFHIAAVAGLLTACTFGPAASPPPSTSPESTDSPTPTSPTGSPTPTASPAASPSPTFNSEQIAHPTGANDIVLRMEQGGGFMMFELGGHPVAPVHAVRRRHGRCSEPIDNRREAGGESAHNRYVAGRPHGRGGHPGAAAVRARHRSAGECEGQLRQPDDRRRRHDDLLLNAGGEEKVVNVYALFEMPDPNVPDAADRAGFAQLRTALMNFEQQVEDGIGTTSRCMSPSSTGGDDARASASRSASRSTGHGTT